MIMEEVNCPVIKRSLSVSITLANVTEGVIKQKCFQAFLEFNVAVTVPI